MSRIAVIQTAFPGDVILCTPVFESLQNAGHEVVAVVRPDTAPLLKNNPFIEKIFTYDKKAGVSGFLRAVFELKSSGCGVALIIQRYFKSGLLPLFAGVPRRIGFDRSSFKFLYTDVINYREESHEVERCLSLCEGFSETSGFSPKIFISDDDKGQARELLGSRGITLSEFVVIAPGSIWDTKRWRGYAELIDLIGRRSGYRTVMLGSSGDHQLCEAIKNKAASNVINLAGQTDLPVSAAIMEMALLVIANDSAPAHIAAAIGTPVVAIFGPTSTKFGFTPYTSRSAIVENRHLYCRPCSLHGPRKCPEKHFRCMREISADEVWAAGEKLLKS